MPTLAERAQAELARRELERRSKSAKPNYTPPKRKMDTSANLQTLFTQGVTFGQSPRITGAMGAVMGIPDAIRQGDVGPIAEAYRQNRQAEIDRIDQARAQTGLAGMGMEALGGIATGGALARAGGQLLTRVAPKAVNVSRSVLAKQSGSTGAKVARSGGRLGVATGGGAVAGGAYGSGEGRAAENALYGAAGGAAGKVLVKGAEGIGVVGKRLINRYGPNIIPADQTAARRLLAQIEEFGEDRVVAEFNRLRAAGIRNPTLAEIVPSIARRVGSVARNDDAGARVLATQRAGGMVGDVPILAVQATKGLSRRRGTVAGRKEEIGARKSTIQTNMMAGIQNQSAEISPRAANALRTANLSRPVQSVENNLRTDAATFGNDTLSTEAGLLRAVREGEQVAGGARAPGFDPRQTQDYSEQMLWAEAGKQGLPIPNRIPLIEAIRKLGGIKDTYVRDGMSNWRPRQRGEVEGVLGRHNAIPGLINNRSGLDPADMAEQLRQAGYLGEARIRGNVSTWADENASGGTVDDIVALLDNYQKDPDMYRYGIDEKWMDDFSNWAEQQSQLEQGGLLGKLNDIRARVSEDIYNRDMAPQSDDFLFDGVPSQTDTSVPRRMNVGTVESLRQQISGAEGAALANPDQQGLARSLGNVRRELVDPVRQQFPEYDRTLRVGETFNKELDAMDLATGSGNKPGIAFNYKVPTEDVSNALAKLSGRELRGYRQAAAESLAGNFSDNRINMTLLESLGGRGGLTQERLAAQFPVNRVEALADTSNALVNRMNTARDINPNFGSQTASNLATDAMSSVEGFASLPMTRAGLVQRVATWLSQNAGGLTPAERVAVVDLGTRRMTDDVAAELLRIAQTAQARQLRQPANALFNPATIGVGTGVGTAGQINAGTSQGYQR